MSSSKAKGIAIFASGAGSNAQQIIAHFENHSGIAVRAVFCNHPTAGVLRHAHQAHLPAIVITRRLLNDADWMHRMCDALEIDFIVLAGFLLLIPESLVQAYPDRIVNIHPALLPKYGGKGMYGMHVHEAVKAAGERETGITIHLVDPNYDEGRILVQKRVSLDAGDTPEMIAQKVHALEHAWYPRVIEDWILSSDH